MKRFLSILIWVAGTTININAQGKLHQWYEKNNLGVDFNLDQSKALIVGADRVTLWDTTNGQLLQSSPMPMYDGKTMKVSDFEYIDASPDLSEFLYKYKGTYQRYLMDIEDRDLFPDFQKHRVKQIIGYDSSGWMVFFSEGFYQGFYRVQQKGNISNLQFISLEYISEASMSNDHKYILFSRDNTFRYIDLSQLQPGKPIDTNLPAASWKDEHLPSGMVTLYEWDSNKKDGKEVQWRYFIELGKEPGKKLKGKKAQDYFPTDNHCDSKPFYTYGATEDSIWVMYYYEKDLDRAKTAYQYTLQKVNRKTCETSIALDFCEPKEDNASRKQQKRDNYFAKRREEKAKQNALRPNWYREYMSKFVNLPNTYVLNYETIAGVDVTNFQFVQNEKYRMGNPQEMAIGRICNCSNGNKVVLRVTRTQKSGMDTQSFRVFTYDSTGKPIDHQTIAQTQKYKGDFPQLSYFTINSTDKQWTASVKIKYLTTGKERNETYSGNCNPNQQ